MIWVSDDYARGASNACDLVEAYAWLELASQSNVQEELQIKILAKLDHIGARLPADRRDAARTRVMHLAELLRSRAPSGSREAATLTRSRLEPVNMQRVAMTLDAHPRKSQLIAIAAPRCRRDAARLSRVIVERRTRFSDLSTDLVTKR